MKRYYFLLTLGLTLALFVFTLIGITCFRPALAQKCDLQEYHCYYHAQGFNDEQIAQMERQAAKEYEERIQLKDYEHYVTLKQEELEDEPLPIR